MSKKFKVSLIAVTVVLGSLFAYNKLISSDRIVAKVNGKAIYQSQVTKEYYNMIDKDSQSNLDFDKLDNNMKYNIVKSIVIGDVLEKMAIESKVDEDQSYKKALSNAIKEIRQKVYLDNLIEANITQAAIDEEYKKIAEATKNIEEVKVEQLLFENEEDANNAFKLANTGKSFEEIKSSLAKSKINVKFESLEYFSKGEMLKDFEEKSFELKVGEISRPFKTDFGWHIVKLNDKRLKAVQPLSEMQEAIKSSLTESFISKLIEDIIQKNSIEILVERKDNEQK
jgi:parvulin-like peptidyl-prolyl isomerase